MAKPKKSVRFTEPLPFKEAIDQITQKKIVGSAKTAAQWAREAVGVRHTAFWSARVRSASVLDKMKGLVTDHLSQKIQVLPGGATKYKVGSKSEFIKKMMNFIDAEGIPRKGPRGSIQDIGSSRRLGLIFDVQTRSAQKFGEWKQGQAPEILEMFPAKQFVRVVDVDKPRPLHAAHEDEIHLKTDEFWTEMNAEDIGGFGVPWPPFGYNSGMDVREIDRDEAIEAGVLLAGEELDESPAQQFADMASASVEGMSPDILGRLKKSLGDIATVKKGVCRVTPIPDDLDPLDDRLPGD